LILDIVFDTGYCLSLLFLTCKVGKDPQWYVVQAGLFFLFTKKKK